MRAAAVLVLLTFLAGCGGSHRRSTPPVSLKEWIAVVNDWGDNARIDEHHRCAAVVDAFAHLESISFPSSWDAVAKLRAYGRGVCTTDGETGRLFVGMSDADLAAAAGFPTRIVGACWIYANRSACLDSGRVVTLRFVRPR
jgi:hypothetical protein